MERGEAPFAALTRSNEGLYRVALWGRLGFAAHHRPAYRVHYGDIGTQEPHVLDLPYQPRPPHPLIKEFLMERGDLLTPLEVSAIERDEISVFRENGCEGVAAAQVPAVY
jgi:hypothetical protein